MDNLDYVKLYLKLGCNLTLDAINSKIPTLKNWNNIQVPKETLFQHKGNFSWVLDNTDLIIDVDVKNNGLDSYNKLLKDLNINKFDENVITPSKGFHIYFKKPKDFNINKTIKEYEGIDFLSKGAKVTIPPSVINNLPYTLLHLQVLDTPFELLQILKKNESFSNQNYNFSNQNENYVRKLLYNLNPSCSNDEWVKIGMALHSWNSTLGYKLWEEWSQKGSNYTEFETEKRWKSFDTNKDNKVSLATLHYKNKEVEFIKEENLINELITKISNSELKDIELNIYKDITKYNLNSYNIVRIEKAIQDRIKYLTGVKPKIQDIRSKLSIPISLDSTNNTWYEKWVYVNTHASFVNLETMQIYKSEAFNLENNHHVKELNTSAFTYISKNSLIPVVEKLTYEPYNENRIIIENNVKLLNTFQKDKLPKSKKLTEEGKEYINRLTNHIEYLLGIENKQIFIEWLAFQIQHKGKKINWSPLIQSVEGLGKTFFMDLFKLCLGEGNYRVVTTSDITDKYNSWATNACVVIINELKIQGHNRYDIINELKPLITDNIISIKEKFVKTYMVKNVSNYICFTNYKDAIPISATDRRYWIIFSPLQSKEDLETISKESNVHYFTKLFDGLKIFYQEVLYWLENYTISKEFLELKTAPHNSNKNMLIAMEEDAIEGLSELKEVITNGGKGICKECFISDYVIIKAKENNMELVNCYTTIKRNYLFKKLGYMLFDKRIFWNGKQHKIWVNNSRLNKEDIIELLDKTI